MIAHKDFTILTYAADNVVIEESIRQLSISPADLETTCRDILRREPATLAVAIQDSGKPVAEFEKDKSGNIVAVLQPRPAEPTPAK